jgi:hypothetical protein
MEVRRGDRVRLVANVAESLMERRARNKYKINWLKRRGVVIRVSAPTNSATVKWDDRATIDLWPMRALERE